MRWILLTCLLFCGCATQRQHKMIVSTEVKELNYAIPLESRTAFKVQYEINWTN